jgi:glycine/D-amino acid oxidase-like deaminating enzyme
LIKQLVAEHGLDCEFEENGSLVTAMDDKQARALEHDCNTFKAMRARRFGHTGQGAEAEIKSPRYIAGMTFPYTGIVNPFKLARGMKALVEEMGVEILEHTGSDADLLAPDRNGDGRYRGTRCCTWLKRVFRQARFV